MVIFSAADQKGHDICPNWTKGPWYSSTGDQKSHGISLQLTKRGFDISLQFTKVQISSEPSDLVLILQDQVWMWPKFYADIFLTIFITKNCDNTNQQQMADSGMTGVLLNSYLTKQRHENVAPWVFIGSSVYDIP